MHFFESGVLNAAHSLGSGVPLQFTIVVTVSVVADVTVEVDEVFDVAVVVVVPVSVTVVVRVVVVVDVHDAHMRGQSSCSASPNTRLWHSGGTQSSSGTQTNPSSFPPFAAAKSSTDAA